MTFCLQTNGQTKRQNNIMEAYPHIFINCEQNNCARFLLIIVFVYNNSQNANTGQMLFELKCGQHCHMFFENEVYSYSKSCSTNKPAKKLQEKILICRQNLLYAPELQEQAHDTNVKSHSYTPGRKIWLNGKYIQTKHNQKLEAKFFI